MQLALIKIGFWKTCINCENWSNPIQRAEENGPPIVPLCKKWNSLPPPDVISIGCPSWLSAVPF